MKEGAEQLRIAVAVVQMNEGLVVVVEGQQEKVEGLGGQVVGSSMSG
jgi:hypothetical protein